MNDTFHIKIINDILFNSDSYFVTVFKEYLIYDDCT